MFERQQLVRCQLHKAALLQKSDRQRRALISDARQLRASAGWIDLGIDLTRRAGKAWTFAGPVWAWWRAHKRKSPNRLQNILSAVHLAKSLSAIWRKR